MHADLHARVTPRSSRNRLEFGEGLLRLWVTAPPTDGQANDAVCRMVANKLGVAPTSVSVVRGQSGREKTLRVEGCSLEEALRKLEG
ncbi:MAG TPA: DUF167 domain-containing protein [Fimbriimonas sp.]